MKISNKRVTGVRESPRKASELAAVYGLSTNSLANILRAPDAPKPVLDGKDAGHGNPARWYAPSEVAAYMARRNKESK